MGFIYPDDYKLKKLIIDTLRIIRNNGVKCYTKFNFKVIDPESAEKKIVTSNA